MLAGDLLALSRRTPESRFSLIGQCCKCDTAPKSLVPKVAMVSRPKPDLSGIAKREAGLTLLLQTHAETQCDKRRCLNGRCLLISRIVAFSRHLPGASRPTRLTIPDAQKGSPGVQSAVIKTGSAEHDRLTGDRLGPAGISSVIQCP